MKLAIILSLLAIGYLIYWNSRRLAERYKPIAASAAEHARIEELMRIFGQRRDGLAEIKQAYAARFGSAADLAPGWPLVTRSEELAVENLKKFQFDLAVHFMGEAVRFAMAAVDRKAQETGVSPLERSVDAGTASDGNAGLAETRQNVQDALNRRD